jgi:hypothetical protein
VSKYPAIPEFNDAASMAGTVRAMKEIVEQLAGARTTDAGTSRGAPSVFVNEVPPSTLLDPTHKVGDLWIKPGPPIALSYWSGTAWVQVAP